MATIVLDVQDESLLTQIKKACQLLKGVASVRVHKSKNEDITKTAGYKEAMDDIKHGRVTEYASLKDFYKEMGLWYGIYGKNFHSIQERLIIPHTS